MHKIVKISPIEREVISLSFFLYYKHQTSQAWHVVIILCLHGTFQARWTYGRPSNIGVTLKSCKILTQGSMKHKEQEDKGLEGKSAREREDKMRLKQNDLDLWNDWEQHN